MRFIDADALVNVVETARKKARTLTGMDFVMVTENQPTIDAIPVEWLVSWINRHPNDLRCVWFASLEMEWQIRRGLRWE